MAGKYKNIIWDWNGTLLDDVEWAMKVENSMLAERNMRTMASREAYQDIFCFPIIKYYSRLGYDFASQSYETLAEIYTERFNAGIKEGARLTEGASEVISRLKTSGIKQIILSASQKDLLQKQVSCFDIKEYFDEILGISDIYAESKIDLARDYISRTGARDIVLIGDTVHDFEVARAIGAQCLLVARGHQSYKQLCVCGVTVLNDITEVMKHF